ncbi:uncharacterized protein LOC144044811 isoform X1 [Vanacampus margaritifer]
MDALAGLGRNEELKGGQLTAAEELQSATTRRYDNIIGRIGDLTKKCEQYEDASDTMEENVGCMSEAMAKLQASFYMEEFKRDSAAAIMSDHDERGDPRGGTNSKNQGCASSCTEGKRAAGQRVRGSSQAPRAQRSFGFLHTALFVAEEDAQSFGEILQTTQPQRRG